MSKQILAFALLVCLCGCKTGTPERVGGCSLPEDLKSLQATQAQFPMAVRLSPDGARVLTKIRHDFTFELIVQHVDNKAAPISIISSETQMALTWAPDGNRVSYFARPHAGQPFQLYIWTPADNRVLNLPVPDSQEAVGPIRWAPRGDALLYISSLEKKNRLELVTLKPKLAVKEIGVAASTHSYAWSSDGKEFLASLTQSPDAVAIYDSAGNEEERIALPSAEEIDSFGWSTSGQHLILSLRRSREEWFRLVELDRRSRQARACLSGDYDLKSPLPTPDGQLAFQVSADARTLLGHGNCGGAVEIVGPKDGIVEPHFVKGQHLYALYSGPERPPELIDVNLATAVTATVYAPPTASNAAIRGPERIRVPLADGTTIPGLLWRSGEATGQVVVNAHGGPHLQDTSQWDLLTSVLVRAGADYLTANYHGTPGYGHSFGESEDTEQDIHEVISLCEYAVKNLRPRNGKVVLVGASYGAYLAAFVAQRRPDLIRSVALLSMLRAPNGVAPASGRPHVRVLQFHGANDEMLSAEEGRQAAETLLGSGATSPPYGCFHLFEQEGHTIWRTANVARMYGAVARLVTEMKWGGRRRPARKLLAAGSPGRNADHYASKKVRRPGC